MYLNKIEDMQYDFKQKLNKIDSQKYRNLRIQEIDWKLNEAYELFIKCIAEPRYRNGLGVEINTRTISDLRPVVIENTMIATTSFDNTSYQVVLPDDYWFMLSNKAIATKGSCVDQGLKTNERQHNDDFELSPFDNSSFEWRETNYLHFNGGLRFFTDGTFNISKVYIDYIKHPPYMHNAQGLEGGSYKLPSGQILTGKQDCLLDAGREIVDIAVLITTGDLQMADYQVKMAKTKLND